MPERHVHHGRSNARRLPRALRVLHERLHLAAHLEPLRLAGAAGGATLRCGLLDDHDHLPLARKGFEAPRGHVAITGHEPLLGLREGRAHYPRLRTRGAAALYCYYSYVILVVYHIHAL